MDMVESSIEVKSTFHYLIQCLVAKTKKSKIHMLKS